MTRVPNLFCDKRGPGHEREGLVEVREAERLADGVPAPLHLVYKNKMVTKMCVLL